MAKMATVSARKRKTALSQSFLRVPPRNLISSSRKMTQKCAYIQEYKFHSLSEALYLAIRLVFQNFIISWQDVKFISFFPFFFLLIQYFVFPCMDESVSLAIV